MILIRLILLCVLIWLGYRIWRLLTAPRGPGRIPPGRAEEMVRCDVCALHVPRARALSHDSHWFCCEDHRRRYFDSLRGG